MSPADDTITLYHGTRSETLELHPGICFTTDPEAAACYGPNVFTVEMNYRRWWNAPDLGVADYDGIYPGDRDLDEIDYHVIRYDDQAPENVMWHDTTRFITEESLSQITVRN